MIEFTQTPQARADMRIIGVFIADSMRKQVYYGRYTQTVRLSAKPQEWSSERTQRALIDYVDGGWSPFGGCAHNLNGGLWSVTVYTN